MCPFPSGTKAGGGCCCCCPWLGLKDLSVFWGGGAGLSLGALWGGRGEVGSFEKLGEVKRCEEKLREGKRS